MRGLLAAGVEVPLVLSQPDRPAGRKRVLTPPPVATLATELGLPLLQPERAIDALDALRACQPAAIAICAYGQLLPADLLALCPWLNLHPSLLPRWRGAAPIERALMAGDATTGVAIMETVLALDEGPVVSTDAIVLTADSDTAYVEAEALRLGVPALVRAITAATDGSLASTPQALVGATYAEKLVRDDRMIDPVVHTTTLTLNRIRGLRPHIGALLAFDDETFTIWRAESAADAVAAGVVVADGVRLLVGLADGAIEITELQTAGKRPLATAEWLRGRRTPPTRATRPA
ncbi:MAG: methionyl-tRNA formyltransferase [Actinobacteria bacterium]|nr:methionyl-tRNA formyltransferase [Actinomycetota bacterium]